MKSTNSCPGHIGTPEKTTQVMRHENYWEFENLWHVDQVVISCDLYPTLLRTETISPSARPEDETLTLKDLGLPPATRWGTDMLKAHDAQKQRLGDLTLLSEKVLRFVLSDWSPWSTPFQADLGRLWKAFELWLWTTESVHQRGVDTWDFLFLTILGQITELFASIRMM